MLSREIAEDEVTRHLEKTEVTRKMIADLAKGSNCDMERWIQNYTEFAGLDDEQKKTEANGSDERLKQAEVAQEESQPQHRSKTGECVSQQKRWKKRQNGRRKFCENEKRAEKSRENRRRKGVKMVTMNGFQWCLTWRQVAHASRPLTQRMRLRRSSWMNSRKGKQEEEVMVSFERRVYRCQANETNGKGKGKGEGGRGKHEGKGRFGGNGQHGSKGAPKCTRKVQNEVEEARETKVPTGPATSRRKEESTRGRSRYNVA